MTTGSEATSEIIAGLVARLEKLEAVEAIRDVMFRYARGADRGDIDLFKSCYWPDATDCHWFWNGNAHEFADYVIPLLREIPNSQHSITNPIIEIALDATAGNQAKCADLLGINRNTLRKKITELDIPVTRRRKLM